MLILGIETSCDETSAAVVEDGVKALSNIVSSQIDLHGKYGGVVPEVASRKHVELILPTINEALEHANCDLGDLDAIAVINRPGLIGALIVGVAAAKAISLAQNKPLIGVHHLEAHMYANFIAFPDLQFPFVCLIVSGGHSDIVYAAGHGQYEILARTRDDAAGECFDKCARAMGLGYPGGPIIDRIAKEGNANSVAFPRASVGDSLDFSFSGLKTAVIRFAQKNESFPISDLAAAFQEAVVDVLVDHTIQAARQKGVRKILMAGGVAANSRLRAVMVDRAKANGFEAAYPPMALCTDNAAMAAAAGYYRFITKGADNLLLDTYATEPLTGEN